jgi:site-specific recombinase XerD
VNLSSDRTFLDQWTDWLATDAPRWLAPTTIEEYKRQVVAFARWMETTLDVPFSPECITSYRMDQYAATLEAHVQRKIRKPATLNKAVAALASLGAWLVATGICTDTPARRLRSIAEQPVSFGNLDDITTLLRKRRKQRRENAAEALHASGQLALF